jgi:hypothetical protein
MSTEYKYKKLNGDWLECDSCSSLAPLATFEQRDHRTGQNETRHLCEVCASSYIANAVQYPSQYENVALYQALGRCTNIILDAVTKRRPK